LSSKIVRMCLNWKVLLGLAVVGVGVWVTSPGLLASVVPVLLVAVCPLSMVLMMRSMHSEPTSESQSGGDDSRGRAGESPGLAELKAELARTQEQQEALALEISRIEAREQTAAEASGQDQEG
jgi:hypothetical protein